VTSPTAAHPRTTAHGHPHHPWRLRLTALLAAALGATQLGAAVTLKDDDTTFTLANDRLTVKVLRSNGSITAVHLDGSDLLGGGTGYWSMSASSGLSRVSGFGRSSSQSVTIDPAANGGSRAEVACRFQGSGKDGAFPGTCEVRYALADDSTTLHATASLAHGPGDAPFRIGEGRFVIKLDPRTFDYLAIDRQRHRTMPSPADWLRGQQMNLKEVRKIVTGSQTGHVEHKYAYSAMLGAVPAYGWAGTRRGFGAWMINPSTEYIAGGPTKMELTGHLDVGNHAVPTLLNMWHGSHYGGTVLTLAQDEPWNRVIGPFAIHFNKEGTPMDLWKQAVHEARAEQSAWPYDWVKHPDYPPPAARGALNGKIQVADPLNPGLKTGAIQIGLTSPDWQSNDRWNGGPVDWQRDGKQYQYWTTAGTDGSFTIRGVRPGSYVLRAFTEGVPGEWKRTGITIKAGAMTRLEPLRWIAERAGPTLWEIGIPDRGAAEFRNGDRYWQWGNHLRYRKDFPQGVDYLVGSSRWENDWHLCQPLDLSPDGKVLGPSVWKVRFDLKEVPAHGAHLRIGFCGSRGGVRLDLRLNGKPAGATGPLPENGVMHRDSHRGFWFERGFPVPASALVAGRNTLELQLSGRTWHQGVLYDFVRLEAVEPALTTSTQP
jgi:rhamnogalacturonan endolyase